MPAPFTLAKALQDALVAFLTDAEEMPGLVGVPVVGRRKGIITNDIEAVVAALGACIYVFPGLPAEVNKDLPGPFCNSLSIRVRCIETPSVNETLPDCYELVELVLTGLHEADFSASAGLAGLNQIQALANPVQPVEDEDRVIFDVLFSTSVGLPASEA